MFDERSVPESYENQAYDDRNLHTVISMPDTAMDNLPKVLSIRDCQWFRSIIFLESRCRFFFRSENKFKFSELVKSLRSDVCSYDQ